MGVENKKKKILKGKRGKGGGGGGEGLCVYGRNVGSIYNSTKYFIFEPNCYKSILINISLQKMHHYPNSLKNLHLNGIQKNVIQKHSLDIPF